MPNISIKMGALLKVFVLFFALNAATAESKNETENDSHQFHIDEHKETREILKSKVEGSIMDLWRNLTRSNSEMLSILDTLKGTIETKQAELSANMSRDLHVKMGTLYQNLSDSITQKLASSDSMIKRSLQNISESFNQKVTRSESLVLGDLENLKTTIHRNLQWSPLFQKTAVEEVPGDSGTIEFNGQLHPKLKRKIWIIQGNANLWNVTFKAEMNGFFHLSLCSVPASSHLTNGSEVLDWSKEVTFSQVQIVLVILSMRNNSMQASLENVKLNLKFEAKMAAKNRIPFVNSKEVRRSEGLQSVSHPMGNKINYPRNTFYYSLIAPSSGNTFRFTLKYMDIPGSPPQCGAKMFTVFFLTHDSQYGDNFYDQTDYDSKPCGQVGHVSEFLGQSEVAFVWFWSATDEVGKGFRIEAEPSE